jgi:hypothetical protein
VTPARADSRVEIKTGGAKFLRWDILWCMSKKKAPKPKRPQLRFGIGEWYGKPLTQLSVEERRYFASIQALPKAERPAQPCPFLSMPDKPVNCTKAGGLCSLRLYEKSVTDGSVSVAPTRNTLRTTCPARFEQSRTIYRWIGEKILGNAGVIPIGQTPFLEPIETMGSVDPGTRREVGRIDNILIVPDSTPLEWCPVELQAVYFSGKKMALDFENIAALKGIGLPWPVENRRPDYRSSGPKRLLPQLSTKVPTLSGWYKRMAVVVDEDFFNQLGKMKPANDLSNADLAWFVVQYEETPSGFVLKPKGEPFITKLKEAEAALVAATPVPRPKFEAAIRTRLQRALAKQ